jgi:peptidoglycan glycosyltransferase
MPQAIAVSCNAWFAQAGLEIGAHDMREAAEALNMQLSSPNTEEELRKSLAQASYGQGEVVVTPLRMARLASVIANAGLAKPPKFRITPAEEAIPDDVRLLSPQRAAEIGAGMRLAVTSGTGRTANAGGVAIAGKTGTAELQNAPSHSWFIGYLPYGAPAAKRVAFAILIVNGGYGARAAAPFAPVLAGLLQELQLM